MRKQAYLILASAVAAVAAQAQAAVYTWVPVTGNQNWNNNTHDADAGNDLDNWGTGDPLLFPNASSDVANVNNDITGTLNLSLIDSITIGHLNLGDVTGNAAFNISGPSLTFDSGVVGVPSQINVRNSGIVANSIGAPITLNNDLLIHLDPSTTNGNRQGLSITGNVQTTGRTITITGGYKKAIAADTDGTQMTIAGADSLIGSGTIINSSDSPLVITGQKLAFTGTLVANGQGVGQDGNTGTLTVHGGSLLNAAEFIVNGYHDGTTQWGGKLQIGTGSTIAPPPNQRLTQNKITMNGGLFNNSGIQHGTGNTGVLQRDDVATLRFNSGFSLYTTTPSSSTAGLLLDVDTVERGDGATLFFRAPVTAVTNAAGQPIFAQLTAGNGASLVVGSTATSGTATRVIPWIVASGNVSNLGLDNFATYDDVKGIRVLAAGEFSASLASGANVKTGNYSSLAQDWTFNAVFHNGGSQKPTPAGGPERTITISSGGLILSNSGVGGFGDAGNVDGRAGVLNFPVEAVIMNNANNTSHISSKIIAPAGLTKGGFGRLILTGPVNEIAGPVHVGGGVLQVGDGTYDSSIGDGDVSVHAGAVLDIRVAGVSTGDTIDIIGDDAAVDLFANGLYTGQISIAGGIDTVGTLMLGGVTMPAGYYGSTAAATANSTLTVFASDSYFAGNGLISVVPEPVSLGMGAVLASFAMLRRRRQ